MFLRPIAYRDVGGCTDNSADGQNINAQICKLTMTTSSAASAATSAVTTSRHNSSAGAIAGAVIGGLVVVSAVIAGIILGIRYKKRRRSTSINTIPIVEIERGIKEGGLEEIGGSSMPGTADDIAELGGSDGNILEGRRDVIDLRRDNIRSWNGKEGVLLSGGESRYEMAADVLRSDKDNETARWGQLWRGSLQGKRI